MTGICGLIGPESQDLEKKAGRILSSMRSRGTDSRIFSRNTSNHEQVIIGMCDFSANHSFEKTVVPIALDGTFFRDSQDEKPTEPAGPGRLVQTPGAFSFLTFRKDRLVVGRDIVGQKPLYFGHTTEGTLAFASLSSPLKEIGVNKPEAVPPGSVMSASSSEDIETQDFALQPLQESPTSEEEALQELEALFREAVGRTLPRKAGIAFSGGLDSGLVAKESISHGLEPELISVGLRGQEELKHATHVAENLGLRATVKELSEKEVLDALPNVVNTIETTDPVIVGISVPIYFACAKAQEIGLKFLAAGQLSDEMFGGYGRFEDIALENREGDLEKEMFASYVAASANDFDPGDKLAVAARLELCCPFAYLPLVRYALKLPVSLRVKKTNGLVIRKYILRKLAAKLGLPESVSDRPKKAVQYSSGVQRVLLKEAKRRGKTPSKMLESFVT